jgi:hypothetical protein
MKACSPYILMLLSLDLARSQNIFVADSMHVVWGERNYSSSSDCSARVRLASTDTSIVLDVDVEDDVLVFGNDPLNSDHIELWFSIPQLFRDSYDDYYKPRNVTSYLSGSASYLYLFNYTCDVPAFEKELQNPKIEVVDGGNDKFLHYDRAESWLREEIDEYLREPRTDKFKKTPVFYGMVHFGVMPQTNKVLLYDRDAYLVLERQVGISLPDYSKYVQVTSHVTQQGYSSKIILPINALGFVPKTGVEEVLFSVNIIDTDLKGMQQTVLSTSSDHKWADPRTFNYLRLPSRIGAPLYSVFPEFGGLSDGTNQSVGAQLLQYLSRIFVFSSEGWIPIDRECDQFYVIDRPTAFWLPNIQKCRFKLGTLAFRQDSLGKHSLDYFSASDGTFLIANHRTIFPLESILKTFLLPSGDLCFITTEFHTPWLGDIDNSSLFLITRSTKTRLAEYWLESTPYIEFTDSLKVTRQQWDQRLIDWGFGTRADWLKLISFDDAHQGITLDLGRSQRIKISWDEHGANVSFQRM